MSSFRAVRTSARIPASLQCSRSLSQPPLRAAAATAVLKESCAARPRNAAIPDTTSRTVRLCNRGVGVMPCSTSRACARALTSVCTSVDRFWYACEAKSEPISSSSRQPPAVPALGSNNSSPIRMGKTEKRRPAASSSSIKVHSSNTLSCMHNATT